MLTGCTTPAEEEVTVRMAETLQEAVDNGKLPPATTTTRL